MDLMTIVFGYFAFKNTFSETKNCDFEDDYDYDDYNDFDDCDFD